MEATAVIRSQGIEYFISFECVMLVEPVHDESWLSFPFEYQWENLDRCVMFSFSILCVEERHR